MLCGFMACEFALERCLAYRFVALNKLRYGVWTPFDNISSLTADLFRSRSALH
jgi:hypothetical protein